MSISSWVTTWVITNTFASNIWIKSFSVVLILLLQKMIVWNELLIFLVVILYFIDFVLWIRLAFKNKEFNLSKFWKWAFKISSYGIFIIIWVALDEWLHTWTMFSSLMFWFILTWDSIEILRKLRTLWFNTPIFVEKYLISYKNKLDEKINTK